MASTSRYGRPAWALGGPRAEEGREGGGGRGSAISPCRGTGEKMAASVPAVARGGTGGHRRPCPAPMSPARRGFLGSRRPRPLSGFQCLKAALCAAPGVAGGQGGPRQAGPHWASPCGPGRAAPERAASEGPPAAGGQECRAGGGDRG